MWAGQERIREVEAWLEAVNGFGPERMVLGQRGQKVLVLLTREGAEAGKLPGVSSFPGRRMSRIQGDGGSGLQPGAEVGL